MCEGGGSLRPSRWRRTRLARPVLLAAALASCTPARPGALVASPPPDDALPFDRVRQKSVHNAYDKLESLDEQLADHGFRSVEIDIHRAKLGGASLPDDWWVYHSDLPSFDGGACDTLSGCLAPVGAFHRAHPDHDVITVFVDLKDDLDVAPHRAPDLDARLRASLSGGVLLEPRELRARCPAATSLRDAVAGACAWPTLGELRGRIVVVLTGGDLCSARPRLGGYLGDRSGERAAFIAPRVSSACPFALQAASGGVLFFNLDADGFPEAGAIGRAHLVSRGFAGGLAGGIDDATTWREAIEAGVNILATDRVDAAAAPWTDRFAIALPGGGRVIAGR